MVNEIYDIPIGIPEYFSGKTVFLTGFTGSIGKLLVEKLLYSCPEINKIYVLIREKKGLNTEERAKEIFRSLAFNRIREKYPGVLESKVIAISGSMTDERLGLSKKDEEMLQKEVDIIFHGAASVRFDDYLHSAIKQNTLGTKKMLDLALTMNKLECFVYISTAYTNCENIHIKEKMYPPKADWKEVIKIADKIDPNILQTVHRKFINNSPNTYVFSKSLSEDIVNEYRDRINVMIIRPSIVIPAAKEPLPGWTDNKYGPLALVLGFLFGIVRCSWVNPQKSCNYIYSDIVVRAIIAAAWKSALTYDPKKVKESVEVYNASAPHWHTVTHEEFSLIYKQGITIDFLKRDKIHLVCILFIANELWYTINIYIRHLLSAAFIDLLLIIAKTKPMLIKIRRKVFIATRETSYFTLRTFFFEDDKFHKLNQSVRPEDKEEFAWDFTEVKTHEMYHDAFLMARQGILKPLYDDFETNRKRLWLLYFVDRAAVYLSCGTFLFSLYYFRIPQIIYSSVISFFTLP